MTLSRLLYFLMYNFVYTEMFTLLFLISECLIFKYCSFLLF